MKKILAGMVALAAASTAHAAIVTYSLSVYESSTGTVQKAGINGATTNGWALYATVSQGDNDGLFAFGVDLRGQGEAGGPTVMTMTNRSPAGHWSIDTTDANYDGGDYADKIGGFTTGRAASNTSGVVSGVQDLAQGANPPDGTPGNLARIYGVGQVARTMNNFKPGPAAGSIGPIAYGNYQPVTGSDTNFGTPFNHAGGSALPPGTVRLASGTWTGSIAPSIDQLSVNTTASVWKLGTAANQANNIYLDQSDKATVAFAFRDFSGDPPPAGRDFVSLANTADAGSSGTQINIAVGGNIAVTGSNNSYQSEIDQIVGTPNAGNTPIATIGDEAGNIYVMVKLTGTAADIASVLSHTTADVDNSDSQFAALHAAYDSQFGGGGFNALFKFANISGAKIFNIETTDLGHGAVTIDQIAAVPEPGAMSLLFLSALSFLPRTRHRRS